MSDRKGAIIVAGIIPAAGRGGRMGSGGAKSMLEVDGRLMLIGIVEALRAGGVDRVFVVFNEQVRSMIGKLSTDLTLVANVDPAGEMIDSVRLGLDTADRDDVAGFLVCPCDAACISAADVRSCIDAFTKSLDRIVVRSTPAVEGIR